MIRIDERDLAAGGPTRAELQDREVVYGRIAQSGAV